jgi:hypothetical protein
MCEHGCRASHNEGQDDRNIRQKQLLGSRGLVGRKPQSKLMSRRTETPYKADGTGKLAPHSQARCSVPEVNGAAAQQEFTFLLREICVPGPAATPGAASREVRRVGTEVSQRHSSSEPSERRPELVASASTPSSLNPASRPVGHAAAGAADGKHGSASADLLEHILSRENMLQAWKRVKANGGAPGMDGMTIAAFWTTHGCGNKGCRT